MAIVVVETYEGLCLMAHGECGCCGWKGTDSFDVGLVPLGDGEYEWDNPPHVACPACGVHEITFPRGFEPPVIPSA